MVKSKSATYPSRGGASRFREKEVIKSHSDRKEGESTIHPPGGS